MSNINNSDAVQRTVRRVFVVVVIMILISPAIASDVSKKDILDSFSSIFFSDDDVSLNYREDVVVVSDSNRERTFSTIAVVKNRGRWNVTRDLEVYRSASDNVPEGQQRNLRINNDEMAAGTVIASKTGEYDAIMVDENPGSPFYNEIGDLGFGCLLFGRYLLPPNNYIIDNYDRWVIHPTDKGQSQSTNNTYAVVLDQGANRTELAAVVLESGEVVPTHIVIVREQRIGDERVEVILAANIDKLSDLDGRKYIYEMTGQFKRVYPDGREPTKKFIVNVEEVKPARNVDDQVFTIHALGAPEGTPVRYLDSARVNSGVNYAWRGGSIVTNIDPDLLKRLDDSFDSHGSTQNASGRGLVIRLAAGFIIVVAGIVVLSIIWRKQRG